MPGCIIYAGKGFSEFKKDLADLAVSVLGPIGAEPASLSSRDSRNRPRRQPSASRRVCR